MRQRITRSFVGQWILLRFAFLVTAATLSGHTALAQSGVYQPNQHTLFYLPLDGPDAGAPEGCSIVQSGNLLSFIPDRFGNAEKAIHVAGNASASDSFRIQCNNTKIASNPSPDFTVGYWVRTSVEQLGDCSATGVCSMRNLTILASNSDNGGCRKFLVAELDAGPSPGAYPIACSSDQAAPAAKSTVPVSDGQWHNLIWSFDYTNRLFTFYLDGVQNVQGPLSVTPLNAANFQAIAGAEGGSFALNGDMDDLWIEDHGWTAAEVTSFLPSIGTISVSTNNAAATFTITDGAGHTFSSSGTGMSFANVPPGAYTITFGPVISYLTPPPQTKNLTAGGTLTFSANYVPILLQESPPNVFFNYQVAATSAPPPQSISVTTSTNTSVPAAISVNTTPAGGTWLSVIPSSGRTPTVLTVSVATGLGPGTYSGTITITSTEVLNSPQVIPVTLQVTTPRGPFSSTATWRKLNGSWNSDCDGSFGAIAVDPGNRDTVYIGSSRSSDPCGLYKSANSGKTWTAINTGFPQFGIFPFEQYPSVSKIAIAPSDHSVIYVGTIFGDGTSGRILRSDNAGRIWTDASGQPMLGIFAPTINAPILDISINPSDASIVFAGLSKTGVFKTQDSGKDWMLVRGGTLLPGATDNFYVVRFAQSNLPVAYGAGFTAFNGSLFPCVISEGGEGDCVDFEGDIPFFPFILTDENGETLFTSLPYPTTILGNGPLITDLAIDPSDSNTVYASTIAYPALSIEIIPAPVPNLGVFKTQDGGLHWKPVNGSSDLDVSQFPLFRLVIDPIDPHTLYAVAGASGIFVTTNSGENWERVSMNGLPTGTFIGNLALGNNRRLYALTSNGVYVLGN